MKNKRICILFLTLTFLGATELLHAQQWYKGELHSHSIWSDGRALPETVVHAYKEAGYDFLCLTDHNVMQLPALRFSSWGYGASCPDEQAFAEENSYWKQVTDSSWSHLAPEFVALAEKTFGPNSVTKKVVKGQTWCRLKTFNELTEQFTEEGKFLLISGFEQTEMIASVGHVHLNFLNVPAPLPPLPRETAIKTIEANYEEGVKAYGGEPGTSWFFFVNHPLWQYYNVTPADLIALPQIRFVELLNNDADWALCDQGWSPEKFWDVVNAFRCVQGTQLLLANGSSDRHFYKPEDTQCDVHAWTWVYASELTAESLFQAMTRGDCYISNGVKFKKIEFDKETKTLSVAVDAEPNTNYRIDFIGTKKDFDPTVTQIVSPQGAAGGAPQRTIDVYSDDIGIVLDSVTATEASYTMADDDLYVRARVVTLDANGQAIKDSDPKKTSGSHRNIFPRPAAWTQPQRP
ncbi:MAG: hypothetical protein Q4G68_15035, partial [Planctomycetia bacterium]|nr:hypothetical protein [Planctomycetia bacterium]